MIKKNLRFFISLIFALILISCNDSPTDIGKNFVDPLDGVELFTFDSSVDSMNQSSTTIKNVYSLGASSRLLIGESGNLKAHSLLKFFFSYADTIKEQIANNELDVLDSWIELTREYNFGDTNAVFDYAAYKITSNWTPSGFSADSLSLLTKESNDISSFRTTANDTLYTFHLDTTVVSFWLHDYVDTSSSFFNYGLLISPANGCQQIFGFTAYNTSGENEPVLRIVVQKPGSYIDTLTGYILSDISAVEGNVANVGNENLAIQGSLTSEAKIFFDLSVLPKNITIHSATLTLTKDTIQTKFGSSYQDLLLAYLLADSTKDSIDTDYYGSLSSSGNTYTGDISDIVRAWNYNTSNQGIIVKAYTEFYGVELFAVKGSNAAIINQRPKLKIVYSRKK